MNKEIADQLNKQFTIDEVDYYGDGKSTDVYVFFANEVTKEQAWKLWSDYDEKYQNDEFDGGYEDYLKKHNIKYWIL